MLMFILKRNGVIEITGMLYIVISVLTTLNFFYIGIINGVRGYNINKRIMRGDYKIYNSPLNKLETGLTII